VDGRTNDRRTKSTFAPGVPGGKLQMDVGRESCLFLLFTAAPGQIAQSSRICMPPLRTWTFLVDMNVVCKYCICALSVFIRVVAVVYSPSQRTQQQTSQKSRDFYDLDFLRTFSLLS
jgi:hypothetical protein